MKKRKNLFVNILMGSIILLCAIFLAVFLTIVVLVSYDTYSQADLLFLIGSVVVGILVCCALSIYGSFFELNEKKKILKTKAILLKRVWRVEEKLNQSPSPIFLNCLESIPLPKEEISCSARATVDGKIVCKIHIDSEVAIDTCEEFLKYFHI